MGEPDKPYTWKPITGVHRCNNMRPAFTTFTAPVGNEAAMVMAIQTYTMSRILSFVTGLFKRSSSRYSANCHIPVIFTAE